MVQKYKEWYFKSALLEKIKTIDEASNLIIEYLV